MQVGGERGGSVGHLYIHAEQEVLENFVVAALVAVGLNQIALWEKNVKRG